MKNCWLCCLVAVVLLAPTGVDADVWDVNTNNDNTSSTTRNQLVHGTHQIHDLGAQVMTPDQDWYLITVLFAQNATDVPINASIY